MKPDQFIKTNIPGTALLLVALALSSGSAWAHERGGGWGESKFDRGFRSPEIIHEPSPGGFRNANRSAAHADLENHLAKLDSHLQAGHIGTEEVLVKKGRIERTRHYLYGLVDLGTPEWQIDAWSDALADDEILAGMPSDLVLNFWGDPIAAEDVLVAGIPTTVWTYRVRSSFAEKVTVVRGVVTGVRRI